MFIWLKLLVILPFEAEWSVISVKKIKDTLLEWEETL